MTAIIFLIIFGLIAIGGFATLIMSSSGETRSGGLIAGVVGAFLFIVTWLVSSTFSAEARTVAIVQEFGKATGTEGPGWHVDVPWSNVTHFSTGNQTIDFDGTDGAGAPVAFKLAGEKNTTGTDLIGGGEAYANVNVTWQVENDDKAIKLWENWKEFDRVKSQLVEKNSQSVIAGVMGRYTAGEANKGENLKLFSDEIKTELNKWFSDKGIRIETVSVMKVDLSQAVQDRINKQYQDQEDNKRSVIQQERAKVEADTNIIRQQNLTPDVLRLKCLEIVNNWDQAKNGPLPAGWNCFSPLSDLAVR